MALIRMDLFSRCLMRTVPLTAVVPVDNVRYEGEPERDPDKPYKMLILLNGIYGNNIDWVCAGDVYMMAQERNLVVIMPAGENGFYVDHCSDGQAYGRFIGEELPERMRRMFPVSHRREDTFICGLSMGGYGALRNGLHYGDTFGYAAGLSSAVLPEILPEAGTEDPVDYTRSTRYFESIFGDLERICEGTNSIEWLYEKRVREERPIPKLYMAVGTEDFLLKANRRLKDFFGGCGADLTYEEGPGGHDFVFWNTYLRRVFEWLPLENGTSGIGSGNVKR